MFYLKRFYILLCICIIVLFHFEIVNDIEKRFSHSVLPVDLYIRPSHACYNNNNNNNNNNREKCYGFPSGHTEAAALGLLLLTKNGWIPRWIAFAGIFAVGLQRVLFFRHTWLQVIAGAGFGAVYAFIYASFFKGLV